MTHFLLVYRRSTGSLLRREEFGDDRLALKRRFQLEVQEKDDPDVEVVLLTAHSEEALRRTHARYFQTAAELAAALGDTVSRSSDAGDLP